MDPVSGVCVDLVRTPLNPDVCGVVTLPVSGRVGPELVLIPPVDCGCGYCMLPVSVGRWPCVWQAARPRMASALIPIIRNFMLQSSRSAPVVRQFPASRTPR